MASSQAEALQTIFVVRQLQLEKYLAANKRLYMAFIDMEKVFDRVPRKVIWWAQRKLGVEWIVRLEQGMYANTHSQVHVGEGYSEEFEVKVGVHQGSILSPLLFIIVLESLEECVRRLLTWKEAMEKKGLRVNAGKTKIMICGMGTFNHNTCENHLKKFKDLLPVLSSCHLSFKTCGYVYNSCRVQVSFHAPSVALEWAATASSAMAASTGCTRNAVGSSS